MCSYMLYLRLDQLYPNGLIVYHPQTGACAQSGKSAFMGFEADDLPEIDYTPQEFERV